jgi:prolyl oligopeptidase
MKFQVSLILVLICFYGCKNKNYPKLAPMNTVTDTYFGNKIQDPYRYMENLNDTVFIDWIKQQEKYSQKILKKISKRGSLLNSFNKKKKEDSFLISRIKISESNIYYYLKKEISNDIAKLYMRDGLEGEERLLLNPETLKKNSETYFINYIQPSWDDSKIAVSLTKSDKEFSEVIIVDIKTKEVLKGVAPNSWPNSLGGIDWIPDSSGFIYTYVPDINNKSKNYLLNTRAVLFKIGKSGYTDLFSKDKNSQIPFKEEDFPIIYLNNSYDKFIIGALAGATRYRDTYYATTDNLSTSNVRWKFLFSKEEKIDLFYVDGNDLYYKTAKNATNFKICKTSLNNPDFSNPIVLIKENKTSVITDFVIVKNGIYFIKTKNGVEAKLFHLNSGNEKEIPIPKPSGYLNITSINSKSNDLLMVSEGWTSKQERYRYNFNSNKFISDNLLPVIQHKELQDVVIEEIEIISHDGVKVPLSIVYKKGLKKNSKNRVLLNGYGAYKWSNSPYLYPYLLHWIKEGGVYATAHIRGGGEKGDNWHKGGYKTTKANTWKDFIACAEYLVDQKYTTNKKMAAWGASAGGINIGRAITERPDLFAAAIIRVGILNTLRMEFAPNGKNNIKEFGTVKDSVEFKALLEMDSYHSIKENTNYPAVYLTTGLNDARVPAWQPAKFAARLQRNSTSNKPILLSIDFNGGHGFESSQNKRNEELANIMSFALWQTGHPDYQPKK